MKTEIPAFAPFAIECVGSDCHCYEVIRVISASTVEVRRMKATLSKSFVPDIAVGGFVGHCRNNHDQSYDFESDPSGYIVRLRRGKARDSWKGSGRHFYFSDRPHEFRDFNF